MKATVTLTGELGWVREGQKRDCVSVTADVEVTTHCMIDRSLDGKTRR